MTVGELARILNGALEGGDPNAVVTGVAAIAEAEPGHATFLGNRKYASQLNHCRATVALVPKGHETAFAGALIRVEDPSLGFAKVTELFAPKPVRFAPGIHPSAVVGEGVSLGRDVSIQPGVVIESGASIGDRTILGANVYVGHDAKIGSDCHLHPSVAVRERCVLGNRVVLHCGVVIGSDGYGYAFSEGRHQKIPQTGIVQVDDDVEIGANTTVDRARFGRTWIKEGAKIDNLVQVAHNVVIGRHTLIVAQSAVAGSSVLGDYVTIAGQSAISGHLQIGDRVTVAGQSGVSKDLPAGMVVWGSPAIPLKEEKQRIINTNRIGKIEERLRRLEQRAE